MQLDLSGLTKPEVLVPLISAVGAIVYTWLLLRFRGEFAAASTVKALAGQVDVLEGRMQAMEGSLQHLPTREDTHNLALSIADMRGDVRSMSARLEGMEKLMATTGRKVEMIDQHLQGGSR